MSSTTVENIKEKMDMPKDKIENMHIAIILDSSGSMQSCVKETISGFNEQIDAIKSEANKFNKEDHTFVTLTVFNTIPEIVFSNQPTSKLQHLSEKDYCPEGMTALYDAIGQTITNLKSKSDIDNHKNSYLIIIMTDGMENASREYKQGDIANLSQHLQNGGRWTFTYIGANHDVRSMSQTLNIPLANAMAYTSTPVGTMQAMDSIQCATRSFLSSTYSGTGSCGNFFNPNEDEITDITNLS